MSVRGFARGERGDECAGVRKGAAAPYNVERFVDAGLG